MSWSEPFLGMLEALRLPSEFGQGRRYVRAGRVRALTISTSVVTGLVLDEDGETYRARLAVRAFGDGDWHRIERALAGEAIHAARLLAGELPEELDAILGRFGLSLFPGDFQELALDCGCPGWRRPCPHLAATAYALAESFDADPFGILAWRGRGREELLENLRALRASPTGRPAEAPKPPPPPPPTVAGFWTAGPRLRPPEPDPPGSVRRPDAILEQLDPLNLSVGRDEVTTLLATAYDDLTR